jgi:5'-nucleotidase
MRVLIDMDGVIADFERGFLERWKHKHPDKPYVPLEQRNTFFILQQYPPEFRDLIREVFRTPGFFRDLPAIPGGAEALVDMAANGIEVFICTTPFRDYRNCVLEKYEWVDRHLGGKWVERIILTPDKTIVDADYLIDDKPTITGGANPRWTHILYDDARNRSEAGRKRLTWDSWKPVMLADTRFRQAYERRT